MEANALKGRLAFILRRRTVFILRVLCLIKVLKPFKRTCKDPLKAFQMQFRGVLTGLKMDLSVFKGILVVLDWLFKGF